MKIEVTGNTEIVTDVTWEENSPQIHNLFIITRDKWAFSEFIGDCCSGSCLIRIQEVWTDSEFNNEVDDWAVIRLIPESEQDRLQLTCIPRSLTEKDQIIYLFLDEDLKSNSVIVAQWVR